MGVIKYLTGDATQPVGEGPKIIAHVVNDVGAWGAGFTKALSRRWPKAEAEYRAWADPKQRENHWQPFRLGETHLTVVEGTGLSQDTILVAHMLAQHGLRNPKNGDFRPLRYDALGACLLTLGRSAQYSSAHMPRIGCGLAGGDWMIVGPMVYDAFCWSGTPVNVYDLEN